MVLRWEKDLFFYFLVFSIWLTSKRLLSWFHEAAKVYGGLSSTAWPFEQLTEPPVDLISSSTMRLLHVSLISQENARSQNLLGSSELRSLKDDLSLKARKGSRQTQPLPVPLSLCCRNRKTTPTEICRRSAGRSAISTRTPGLIQ